MTNAGELRLFYLIQTAAHRLRIQADRKMVAAVGATTAQCAILAVLAEAGPAPQRAVAEKLGLNESAMTPMVRRLVDAGLAMRVDSAKDRRVRALDLTPAGRKAFADAKEPFDEINAGIDAALKDVRADALAAALNAMGRD